MVTKTKSATKGGGSRSLLTLLILIIALAACAFSGYLVWEMKKMKSAAVADIPTAETPAPAQEVEADPLYQPMNTFTISLKPTAQESDRVLYLGFSVRVDDRQSLLTLEKYLPEYRSRLFMLLTQQTYDNLATDQGKTQLVASIKHEMSQPLAQNQVVHISDVLINEFILR